MDYYFNNTVNRSCHFLTGDMNFRVPVSRYLELDYPKGKPTFRTHNPKYQDTMQQSGELSAYRLTEKNMPALRYQPTTFKFFNNK